jgi:hypothetical protein
MRSGVSSEPPRCEVRCLGCEPVTSLAAPTSYASLGRTIPWTAPRPQIRSGLERAVPRGRCQIDAKVCRGDPWWAEQDRHVLGRLVRLIPADVAVLAEV